MPQWHSTPLKRSQRIAWHWKRRDNEKRDTKWQVQTHAYINIYKTSKAQEHCAHNIETSKVTHTAEVFREMDTWCISAYWTGLRCTDDLRPLVVCTASEASCRRMLPLRRTLCRPSIRRHRCLRNSLHATNVEHVTRANNNKHMTKVVV